MEQGNEWKPVEKVDEKVIRIECRTNQSLTGFYMDKYESIELDKWFKEQEAKLGNLVEAMTVHTVVSVDATIPIAYLKQVLAKNEEGNYVIASGTYKSLFADKPQDKREDES
jgi:hypothetical protein